MNLQVVQASSMDLEGLVALWNLAYAGYFVPMSWDSPQLEAHVRTGSVDLARSLVWVDGNEPVALSLLGVRPDHAPVADSAHSTGVQLEPGRAQGLRSERGWIGGFGVVPSHRGRGLSVRLMQAHLDHLRETGPRHIQLEVLTQNWAAKSYERAGFTTTRRLLVLQGELAAPHKTGQQDAFTDLSQVPDLLGQLDRLHTAYPPAWTREPIGLLAEPDGLRCVVVGSVEALEGVALVREQAGALRLLDAAARDVPAARELVDRLAASYGGGRVTLVNEPEGSPVAIALGDAGFVEVLAQYEMHWHA